MVQYGAFKIKSIVVKAEFSNPEAIKKKKWFTEQNVDSSVKVILNTARSVLCQSLSILGGK